MSTAPRHPPSMWTLVAVGVALPAAVVLVDQLTWMHRRDFWWAGAIRHMFFPWLAFKTALLAWCAGRFLGATLYGWMVLLWTQALIDIHTFSASMDLLGSTTASFCHTLISAQLGFLALWTILGTAALPWRMTSLFLATAGIIYLSRSLDIGWRQEALPILQTSAAVVVAGVCLALRFAGFRLMPRVEVETQDEFSRSAPFQFGVRHMLMWTAALPPLLLAIQGLDMVLIRNLGLADLYPWALISACVAVVTLATIWLTLGQGAFLVRTITCMAAVGVASVIMQLQSDRWTSALGQWYHEGLVAVAIAIGGERLWARWFALLSLLLAAMLLFLRGAGLILWRSRPASAPLS